MSLFPSMAGMQELKRQLADSRAALEQMMSKFDSLNRRYIDQSAALRSARETNSRYFLLEQELRSELLAAVTYQAQLANRLGSRPQLVVVDNGEHNSMLGHRMHTWSIWLNGVRIGAESIYADNVEQPERLWLVVETLEAALGVKAMRAKLRTGRHPVPWKLR